VPRLFHFIKDSFNKDLGMNDGKTTIRNLHIYQNNNTEQDKVH